MTMMYSLLVNLPNNFSCKYKESSLPQLGASCSAMIGTVAYSLTETSLLVLRLALLGLHLARFTYRLLPWCLPSGKRDASGGGPTCDSSLPCEDPLSACHPLLPAFALSALALLGIVSDPTLSG
mmetsp:Transcript_3723/g.10110  ORF Transcript_3723/g.10110 Transcript_3723/m.10110 type:complete len:124 (+) Transcript_3723:784-1155(+)